MGAYLTRRGSWYAALLAVLLTANSAECPAALSLHGVGSTVAAQVRPYVMCLNSIIGTSEQIVSHCSEARSTAVRGNALIDKAKLDRAIRWLDAMVKQRAECELQLNVEA
jgi:hypothetical protein